MRETLIPTPYPGAVNLMPGQRGEVLFPANKMLGPHKSVTGAAPFLQMQHFLHFVLFWFRDYYHAEGRIEFVA
jgi:hypothetical protein